MLVLETSVFGCTGSTPVTPNFYLIVLVRIFNKSLISMNTLKDDILKLRKVGKTYDQIIKELNCSKSTVSYHCTEKTKILTKVRNEKRKKLKPGEFYGIKRLYSFKTEKSSGFIKPNRTIKNINCSLDKFKKKDNNVKGKHKYRKIALKENFTFKDVFALHKKNQICYLTGRKLNLKDPNTFSFDHITPSSKGGSNTIENLGICRPEANAAKSNLTVDEFIGLCKDVLKSNGYTVTME